MTNIEMSIADSRASVNAGADDSNDSAIHRNSRSAGIEIGKIGATIRITLDRPGALNVIDAEMRRTIADGLPAWADDPMIYGIVIRARPARAFCAGDDLIELYRQLQSEPPCADDNIAHANALIWQLECFGKPTVALIDGAVTGAGVGCTLYNTHRVAGDAYGLRMQDTELGLCLDGGVAHAFARLPRHIGCYLALTGRSIGRADAYTLGLATHCISADLFPEIEAGFARADTIDPLLDERHAPPGPAPIEAHADAIDRCFSADSVEEILARLTAETRDRTWCRDVIGNLRRKSPLALKAALRLIQRARHLDLRQTLVLHHRIACRLLAAPDFATAIGSRTIGNTAVEPAWRPRRLEDVTDAMLEQLFAPMPGHELVLPTLQEM